MVNSLQQIGKVAQAASQAVTAMPQTGTASPDVPFAGVFQSLIQQSSSMEAKAKDAVTGLMNGTGVELHDAMIATQKADMSFELALQVRNKAVAAYQQMMSMQF
jgi:flagellar hook-basal body complex protein FliE